MADKQRAIEDLIAALEDVVITALDKKDAEHEGSIFLDSTAQLTMNGVCNTD